MTDAALKRLVVAISMKREVRVILVAFGVMTLLPVITVLLVSQVGIAAVSASLATLEPSHTNVILRQPGSGDPSGVVSASVVWPVSGIVTLEFGQSDFPYQVMHTGIDIASPNHQVGDPVVAFMPGTVVYSGYDLLGFGNHVIIDHGQHVTSIYGHLDSLLVKVGDRVETGTVIGTRGTTGWSTGPHLHFQIDVYGVPVNPRTFISGNP